MALTIVSGALQTIAFYSPVPYPPQSNWYKLFIMVAIALPYLRLLITSVYIMKDSLRERDNKLYSLVGASNLYMIFPFLFLIIMTSVELVQPMVKGLAFTSLIDCFTFYSKLSFYGAVGYDMPQVSMSPVLSNILTFEHYFMNLFIICAVGRLVEK